MLSHGALGPALRGESIDEVRRLGRASLAGAKLDPTSPTSVAAYSLAATSLFMAGDFAESERALTPASTRPASAARSSRSVRCPTSARMCFIARGRIEDAIADFQSALDTVRYGWEPELPAV